MEIPPSAHQPEPEIPKMRPRPERMKEGWILLALVFGFWILSALVGYFGTGRELGPSEKPAVVAQAEMISAYLIGATGGSTKEIPVTGNAASALSDALDKAKEDAPESYASSRQALTIAFELGEEMPEEALTSLSKSKAATDKAFIELYSAEELTPEEAAELAGKVEGGGYLRDMAAAHAWLKAENPAERTELVTISHFTPHLVVALFGGVFFVGGCFLALLGLGLHFSKTWKTVGFFPNAEALWGDGQAARMATYTVLFIGLGLLMAFVEGGGIWLDVGFMAAMVLVIVGLYKLRLPGPLNIKGSLGKTERPAKLAVLGVAGFMANLPIFALMALLISPLLQHLPPPSHPINDVLSSSPSVMTIVGVYLTAAVFAPILEELTFRGMLFPALQSVWRAPAAAMVLQALMFAAVHPQGPLLWPMLGLVGFTSAFLAHKTGSLIPGLVLHAVHNGFIVTFGMLFG